jgi:tRNA nucleotidyltransferase (CCA-adding enzyme)
MGLPKVIVLQEGADLDALSSALGVQKLYGDALLLAPRYLSRKAGRVFKAFRHLFRITEELPPEFILVLVDTRYVPEGLERDRIKGFVVYDHHPSGEVEEFSGRVEKVGATTTLVVEEIKERGLRLSPEEATLLILGIYEDTGNFTYEGTTPRDLEAASWLLGMGADLRTLRKFLSESYTRDQIEAVRRILSSLEKVYLGDKEVVIATAVLEKYEPDINSLLYEIKDLKEAEAFFVVIEAEGKTYVFGRSQDESIDVGEILSHFGGGGHKEAGALKIENLPAQRIKNLIVSFLRSRGRVRVRVRDIMTSPPFVVESGVSVREALRLLTERGFASAPVVERDGSLVGVVSKKALLKAVRYLPREPVESFALRDVRTLKPEDPVWEAEEILTRFGQTLIPVVEEGRVVGVVTRFDLLRKLREDLGDSKAFRRRVSLPEGLEDLARRVGEEARDLGYKVYLVGGVVRDLLMGREVKDVDFVVEGNALEVARRVAERFGVDLHPFPEFGTAHLKVDRYKLEFATARRETYPKPGSYPRVEVASLKEDLLRRDFTINAMAVSCDPEEFGTLIDFFGGLRDLKEGLVRVLHPLSFIEDPVRVLRALRFAGRFGFRLSKSTQKLLQQAVELGLLKEAPRGRVMNELRRALTEDRLLDILKLYRKYGILEQVVEGFSWTEDTERRLLELSKVIHWHSLQFPGETLDYGWVFLMVILERVGRERALKFLEDISAPSWVRESMKGVFNLKKVLAELERASRNSEIYTVLKGLHPSLLLLLMTHESVRDKVRLYMEKLRKVKVPPQKVEELKRRGLSGRDLGREIERIRLSIMDSLV